ncbi:unnamed protein product, partial [Laminaria digitata]
MRGMAVLAEAMHRLLGTWYSSKLYIVNVRQRVFYRLYVCRRARWVFFRLYVDERTRALVLHVLFLKQRLAFCRRSRARLSLPSLPAHWFVATRTYGIFRDFFLPLALSQP